MTIVVQMWLGVKCSQCARFLTQGRTHNTASFMEQNASSARTSWHQQRSYCVFACVGSYYSFAILLWQQPVLPILCGFKLSKVLHCERHAHWSSKFISLAHEVFKTLSKTIVLVLRVERFIL